MDSGERPSARRARSALVTAATDIVLTDGVEALTVRAAAERAGYSVASLYNHIDGIQGLLAGVRQSVETSLVEALAPATDAPPRTAEALARVFVDYAGYFADRPHAFDLLFGSSAATRAAARHDAVVAQESSLRDLWAPTFSGVVGAGVIAADRVEPTALHLIYLVHGVLIIAFSSTHIDARAVRAHVFESVTWALAAEASHARSTLQ